MTFTRARVAQWVRQFDYLTSHTSLSPIRRGFAPGFVNYKKCTRLAPASDKAYQLLAHGRWFSGTPASSTTKTGRHDIVEILLKVALKHEKQSNQNHDFYDFSVDTKTASFCFHLFVHILFSINIYNLLSFCNNKYRYLIQWDEVLE